MNTAYIKLGLAALMPTAVSVILYLLENKGLLRMQEKRKQQMYGLIFGLLAIIGTEWGIPLNGAVANCRDAAVLTGGLFFGAPAGIIAGIIGGVERWISVAWGVGTFTRTACTLSTIIAGFYAAILRKYFFEDKKPGIIISFTVGVAMEVFHLTMVFITNINTPTEAMEVVKACTVPMVTANGLSVMFTALVLYLISPERHSVRKSSQIKISQTIQRWLLLTLIMAFSATSFFVFRLQNELADTQSDELLDLALDEIVDDVYDTSDNNLLRLTYVVAQEIDDYSLDDIAARHDIAEISLIDKNGIIFRSTEPKYLNYNMADGTQSAAFLCLLKDTEEFVQEYGPISYDQNMLRKYAGLKTNYGFIQVGYDAEHFQADIDQELKGLTRNRHVGETGYILILDEQNNLVSAPTGIRFEDLGLTTEEISERYENLTFTAMIKGEECFCRYRTGEGYFLISVLPRAEAYKLRNIALYVNTFMGILVFSILFGLIYLLVRQVVVNQLKKVNESLSKITAGDMEEVVNVRTNEEFASLSDDINSTVDTLKKYIDEAKARIDKELELAKDIQSSALPNTFPRRKDFDIYAMTDPAKEVGGDFYDFYMPKPDTLNFLVADVSGKGIPAAMFMMRAKTELKSLTEEDQSLGDVFTHGNDALCEGNDAGMFVTAWEGSLDLSSGRLLYANAGHNPPLVRHSSGKFEYLKGRPGFVLAGMDGVRYQSQELQLEPGDTIFLYTDGVTEATNAKNELFGENRLLKIINSREYDDMQSLCRFIKANVDNFVNTAPQFDDITMLALHYIGTAPVPAISREKASIADIDEVTDFVENELERLGCPMKSIIQIKIAIDELYSNIVKYAYRSESGPVTVSVKENDSPHGVLIRFVDEGVPYNPLTKEDPDITLSAEERTIGGLGIFMVRKTMDDMKYRYEGGRNILTIQKNF